MEIAFAKFLDFQSNPIIFVKNALSTISSFMERSHLLWLRHAESMMCIEIGQQWWRMKHETFIAGK